MKIPEKTRKNLRISKTLTPFVDKIICKIKINATKQLQFCTHYNYNEARSHHCFVLHAQQVNDYCAVATCQMILCYYRYYYTQGQIAPALGYTAGSGCPPDQSAGYEQLSCNHLDATHEGVTDAPTVVSVYIWSTTTAIYRAMSAPLLVQS